MESDLIKVEFIYLPVINFSLQQNRVSLTRVFTIENCSEKALNNVRISLNVEPMFGVAEKYAIETIPVNETVRVNNLKLNLSTDFFIQLTERLAGNLFLEITADDVVIFQEKYPIDILAFDQWSGISVLPEMLAAFVTPNHPAIFSIQRKAADILGQMTGNPSLDEYQSRNPNRVKSQMAALYSAIVECGIIYSSVPASFENTGQRVRLVDSVLSQKLGTCLDMSLLYASCLEAIGIHPLIIISKGHAYAGAWLIPDTFPDSVIDDSSFLTKRTAAGINEIILVETTCMNKGKDMLFDEAISFANDNISHIGDFVFALDVKRSRFSGIRPLPQRILNGENWVIKESEEEASKTKIDATEQINPFDLSNLSTNIQVTKQLMWERKLLDLSLRNNLLNTRITQNTIQLISANLDKFEDALADGSEFRLMPKPTDWDNPLYNFGIYNSVPSTDPITELIKSEISQKRLRTYLTEADLEKSLKNLYRASRLSLEENGANTLYLALGMLRWYETPSSERHRYAPILLFPVEIIRKSASKGYVIRSREEDTILNITLLEMLRQNFGINVPGLETLPLDESGVNVRLIYSIFRNSIKNQPKWDVEEQAILGIFSFNKFIMWNDIHNNADKLIENKLVRSIVNGKIEFDVENTKTDASELDKVLTPADIVLPISADSSQLEAIYESINDKTYVLHGPPGTGKSQTITNIIANALYKGKRVLFVAEKMAALEVVKNRLDSIGLGPFCLELHSNKAKKTSVLSQLKVTTEINKKYTSENFKRDAIRLFELRKELNVYIEALHREYPFGLTLYQAITRYLYLQTDNELKFPHSLFTDLTKDKVYKWEESIDRLISVCNACGHPYNNPLTGINITSYSTEIKEQISNDIKRLIEILLELKSSIQSLSFLFGGEHYSKEEIDVALTLISILQTIPELTPALLCEKQLERTLEECKEIIAFGEDRDRNKTNITRVFTDGFLSLDARVILNKWDLACRKWFIPRMIGQRKMHKQLAAFIYNGSIRQVDIKQVLEELIKYQDNRNIVNSNSDNLQSLFGKFAKPEKEKWESIRQIMEAFSQFNKAVLDFKKGINEAVLFKENLSNQLVNGIDAFNYVYGTTFSHFVELISTYKDISNKLSSTLNANISEIANNEAYWIDAEVSLLNIWGSNMDKLKDWYQWLLVSQKLNDLQIGYVANEFASQNIPTNQLRDSFLKGFYRAAIDYIISKEHNLELFKGKIFNDVISKYQELTRNFTEITQKELYAKLAATIPSFTIEAAQNSEVGILQRSIKNNGRGLSIRSLFDQIPNLLYRLCPCMLMSPISVAQYISQDAEQFDLIIFDEASQMPTYEAIGAISRGKNIIIVGDPKQMPPTNFFKANTLDEDNLDKEDLESILDDCLALSIPSHYLLWHYRSKHESLIAFSNSEYYGNKLLTFPSPDNIESKVRLVHIDGVYDKGKSRQNRQEAELVIKEICRRLSNSELRKRSIGIVTFSSAQQSLIEDLLSDLFKSRPDLETIALECQEPLFIKNLENVQGDERDVILFSVGYGPDAYGRVSMNFGPLNREGGERRLNVAVSRARYEMIIFSTLRSDQIDLNRTSATGVAGLKRFLEFAEKGGTLIRGKRLLSNEDSSSIEIIIASKLRELGYDVHTNIGASGYKIDIAIVDKDNLRNYLLGIICDGENYKRTKTTRDREIVQSSVLRLLGWKICRVWTLDWWENPTEVLESIERSIEKARNVTFNQLIANNQTESKNGVENEIIKKSTDKFDYSAPIEQSNDEIIGEPYIYANLPFSRFPSEDFLSYFHKKFILDQIKSVIQIEAPISRSLLCKRVLNSWSISRLGSRIDSFFDELFRDSDCYQTTDGVHCFWINKEQMNSYTTFRPKSERDAVDLPPREIANGIKHILASQIGLPSKDLIRITAQLFGFVRTGNNVESAMMNGIKMAVKLGYVKIENDKVVIL